MGKLIEVSAPSNIALIKYMGKLPSTDACSVNVPTNSSLSLTLEKLRTFVQLEEIEESTDRWECLNASGMALISLSEVGLKKYLGHLQFLKSHFKIKNNFIVRSANNFPSDCGIASSASSFAALTRAVGEFAGETDPGILSKLSRQGSGSSCRSFFSPWALWRGEGAESIDLGYLDLMHAVVFIDTQKKEVSSSEAHKRVLTSPKFEGRIQRAGLRLENLISAMKHKNWEQIYQITRDEYIDMHELFESSDPVFRYRTRASQKVTDACQSIWNFKKDGPIVTMDAGANVHLLYRPDQLVLADKMVAHFKESHQVLTTWKGFA